MKMKTVCFGLILSVCATIRADDWPQWLGPQRDGIWREKGILSKFPQGGAKIVWRTPMWGYASSPLIDGDKLICVGSANNIAIAFNKNTGDIVWKNLSGKEPGYAPPVIYEAGGKRQLIIWHPAAIVSLDPENGKEY